MVDWGLANQIARFAAGAGGPAVEADFPALVAESEEHLRGYTQLELSEIQNYPRGYYLEVDDANGQAMRGQLDAPDYRSGQRVDDGY